MRFGCRSYLPVTQRLNIFQFESIYDTIGVIKRLTKISCEAKDNLQEAPCPSLRDSQESLKDDPVSRGIYTCLLKDMMS